ERAPAGGEEMRLEEQILGRIAVDGELGEHDELGAPVARLVERLDDFRGVAVYVPDRRVELRKRNAKGLCNGVHGLDSRSRRRALEVYSEPQGGMQTAAV